MKTAIKICGLCDPDMAKKVVELGAHYIGIICYPGSKRYVKPELGRKIAKATQLAGGIPVAIFVDQDATQMLLLSEMMGVDTVQLAGSTARRMHAELPENFQRIYVLHVSQQGSVQIDSDQGLSTLLFARDKIMYDGLQSGSGHTFTLHHFMNPYPMPFFLAGGLTAENVENAINTVHPDAVDVSSGVESAPGVKAFNKIKAFINAVRRTD